MRVHGGHAPTREIGQLGRFRLGGHGGLERACAEAQLEQDLDLGAALAHEVDPGDAAVDDSVLDVLGHVGRAHEEHVDRCVAAGEGQRPLARLLRAEPCISEQCDTGLAQPALGRNGDAQAVAGGLVRRSRASR